MSGLHRLFRPRAIIVFALLVVIIGGAWWLYADAVVRRGIEATGESSSERVSSSVASTSGRWPGASE